MKTFFYTLLTFLFLSSATQAGIQDWLCSIQKITNWRTPQLIWAAQHCHAVEVLKILDNGGNPQEEDACGETALHWGAYYSQPTIIDHMLLFDSKIGKRNHEGQTALHWAFTANTPKPRSHNQVVRKLLEAGADPNERDIFGKTPLHYGVIWPVTQSPFLEGDAYEKILESSFALMAEWHANPNIQDNEGNTPLHIALLSALNENLAKPIAHMLILMGANPYILNQHGETAYSIAKARWPQNKNALLHL